MMPLSAAARAASIASRQARADAHTEKLRPVVEEITASGITSQFGIARELNRRGLPTSRGGTWSPSLVAALLRRWRSPDAAD